MFTRFRDSLVYPSRILNFRKDSIFLVFGYIIFFSILMSLGLIIFLSKFESLPNTFTEIFTENLISEEVPCEIIDSELICTKNAIVNFYDDGTMLAYTDSSDEVDYSNYPSNKVVFIFHKDKLLISSFGLKDFYMINELPSEFHNMDFSLIESDQELFAENFIEGLNSFLLENKNLWLPFMVTFELLSNFLFIMLIVLINSWILKARFKIIPFKEVFKMSVYSSTTLYVLLTINGLIALGGIFILLFVIITFRQTNALSMAIYKVIKKN